MPEGPKTGWGVGEGHIMADKLQCIKVNQQKSNIQMCCEVLGIDPAPPSSAFGDAAATHIRVLFGGLRTHLACAALGARASRID